MTDEETERTAELFLSLEGSHSLVVVEHDMKFIHALTARQPGQEGDRAARGQRARRRIARRRAGEREGRRGLSWPLSAPSLAAFAAALPPEGARPGLGRPGARPAAAALATDAPLLKVEALQPVLRRLAHPAQRRARGRGRRGDGHPRPQRRRQDDAAEEPDGRRAGALGHGSRFAGADITHDTPYQRVRRGIGYVPQGREIFGRLTVAGEPADGPGVQARRHARCRPSCSSSSRC